MEAYWMEWLTVVAVFGIAVLSPGPDFVVAVRNSLTYGRRAGMWTALGFAVGVMVHISYTLLGLAVVIAQSIVIFNILKFAGAAYLIYMGCKALRSQGIKDDPVANALRQAHTPTLTSWGAFRSGFITNLLNPKACLFFIALFTQVVHADTPQLIQAFFGLTCAVLTAVWFSVVSFVLTTPSVRARFLRVAKWIDRTCGAVFIALGLKLALTKAPH